MRKYFLYLIAALTITSCGKDDSVLKPDNPSGGTPKSNLKDTIYKNLSYGTSSSLQKLDVYLPAGRTTANTKAIFLIHGGAWMAGDKADSEFSPVVDSIRKRLPDWAIININYRLYNIFANPFPAQEEDIKSAINFVYNNRNEYVISDKWVFAGASAGGHLALLQGYKNSLPVKVKAIINYYGPSDLPKLIAEETDPDLKFGMPFLFNGKEVASSPINYIDANTSPTITFQGTNDATVPKSQQEALHTKLKQNNVPEQLVIFQNEGHGFTDATMTKTYDLVLQFLNTYVK